MTTGVPDGFQRHTRTSPLTEPWEPIYARHTPAAVILGLRLARPHTNSRGLVHGGLITSLADNAMGLSCGHTIGGTRLVTVSLSIDFIGFAKIGQWMQVETDVIKTGSTLCFAQCVVTADGVKISRASATFLIAKAKE